MRVLNTIYLTLALLAAADGASDQKREGTELGAGGATIWPQPAQSTYGASQAVVHPRGPSFFEFVHSTGADSPFLTAAFERYDALTFPHGKAVSKPDSSGAASASVTTLQVVVADLDESHPQLETNESYTLDVTDTGSATVHAKTVYGALRGLETFSQLVDFDFQSRMYTISGTPLSIVDAPRFPHRGLMIDTARHWQSTASIREIIDSLPYAKLNVLHWHMSDTQSFPLESKSHPKLWDGAFSMYERYTQEDVTSIVEYARLRGVRVMVEFDTPGHAESWCTGYPELCPETRCDSKNFGTPLNVASNATFNLLENLFKEMTGGQASKRGAPSGLFPDNFFHLGGDEVDLSCWSKSPSVAAWLKDNKMTNHDGYELFAKRVAEMAIAQGRRPMQWSEVFDHFKGKLPKETIVHIWKPDTRISEVVNLGYNVVRNVAYGIRGQWYLDHLDVKWDAVYSNEPCEGIDTDEKCKLVLGGHGQMWGETVDGSDLQNTIWPRLAAIAEKLWSTREHTKSVSDAAPRIHSFRCRLLMRGVAAAPLDNANARSAPDGPSSCFGPKQNQAPKFGALARVAAVSQHDKLQSDYVRMRVDYEGRVEKDGVDADEEWQGESDDEELEAED